jgi:uncharacterized protein (TIGR03435 family)
MWVRSRRLCAAILFTAWFHPLVLASSAGGSQVTGGKTPDLKATGRTEAQSRTRFEAVTVRKGTASELERGPTVLPGRFEMQNFPVAELLGRAYGSRLVNAPDWIRTERYTIRARAADGATRQEMQEMIRTLLAEQFGLVAHQETREAQVYSLVTLRNDKRPGRWLRPRTTPCPPGETVPVTGLTPDAPPIPVLCGDSRVSPVSVFSAGVTMSAFGSTLANEVGVGAPVVDNTGLSGTFDVALRYSTRSNVAPADAEWPTLFSALEEQLGRRLLPSREPRPVLVIEKIQRPGDDAQ